MIFRPSEEFLVKEAEELHLKRNEEFPFKESFLVEELIQKGDAVHFLEITGGLLTKSFSEKSTSSILFEMFEPSEALATGEVLSLEEKFLAGEGQNITPARYSKDKTEQALISQSVKNTLEKTAKILGVEGYCRIDAFVKIYSDKTIETIIIEVNSLPGMTPATCIFHQCAINGYSPYEFIKGIMDYGKFKVKHSVQI
jgi:D-alanine-D-alanine ligase